MVSSVKANYNGLESRNARVHVGFLRAASCKNPNKVAHAKNPSQGHYLLNDKVLYQCYQGYQPRGSSEARCSFVGANQTDWVWAGQPFRCIREFTPAPT